MAGSPSPFWYSGFYFPGYFILNDFHRVVHGHGHACIVTNHTRDSRTGRINRELKPLFPGYIFGKFDLDENYPLVRWARGVKKVLGFGGYPIPVSEEAIEIIKARIDLEKRKVVDAEPLVPNASNRILALEPVRATLYTKN
jgi:transcription antitermination factor NusG